MKRACLLVLALAACTADPCPAGRRAEGERCVLVEAGSEGVHQRYG